MKDRLTFNPKGHLTIEDVHTWMDGGTVTLITRDMELNNFEIEFVQKVSLVKNDNSPCPGSLRQTGKKSKSDQKWSRELSAVKKADWGQK